MSSFLSRNTAKNFEIVKIEKGPESEPKYFPKYYPKYGWF